MATHSRRTVSTAISPSLYMRLIASDASLALTMLEVYGDEELDEAGKRALQEISRLLRDNTEKIYDRSSSLAPAANDTYYFLAVTDQIGSDELTQLANDLEAVASGHIPHPDRLRELGNELSTVRDAIGRSRGGSTDQVVRPVL